MLAIVYRLLIATVIAFVVSGFFAGFINPGSGFYFFDLRYIFGFLIATTSTALLSGYVSRSATSQGESVADFSPQPSTPKDPSAPREQGTVKWFNVSKGFGFITRENNNEDIFVHYRNIRGEGRRRLFDGQLVEFTVIDGDKGLQADDIEILKN